MRIPELLKEFAPPTNLGKNAQDLMYIINNVAMTPNELDFVAKTLSKILGKQETQPVEKPAQTPVNQVPTPPAKPSTPQKTPTNTLTPGIQNQIKPLGTSKNIMGAEPEDSGIQEAKAAAGPNKQQILDFLKSAKDDAALAPLVYMLSLKKFKQLTKKIVDKKFKFKSDETLKAIDAKIDILKDHIEVATMFDFLNACLAGGVIDCDAMIATPGDYIDLPLTDQKFKTIVDHLLQINLERLGKGEIGLAFAGINALKVSSDINIGNTAIEVKASSGTDFFMKGNAGEGGFGYQVKAAKLFINALNSVGGQYASSNKSKSGGVAALGATNHKSIDLFFQKLGQEAVINLLVSVEKQLCKEKPEIVDTYIDNISDAVSETGSVDYQKLGFATARINFDYYKEMSHHDGVLILNLRSLQSAYAPDADTFINMMQNGIVKQKFALDFRDNGMGGIAYDAG
jgi:hypothetical protein